MNVWGLNILRPVSNSLTALPVVLALCLATLSGAAISAPAMAAPASGKVAQSVANAKAGVQKNQKQPRQRKRKRSHTRASAKLQPLAAHEQQNHINAAIPVAPPADQKVLEVLKYGARKHAEGNYDEAEAAFRHVLSRAPNTVDAFYNLGSLAERKGDLIGALSDYRAALALKPNDKQLIEAVQSVERSLKERSASTFKENTRPQFQPPSSAIDANMPVLNISEGSLAPQDRPPVLPVDGGAFQLSSNKNGTVPAVLGVMPSSSSYPVASQQAPAQPPLSQPPVVGAAPRSHPVARQVLNRALNTGTSMGLRAVGLHCPACQLFRFRF
jgi:tetratricopeptide (TPR) repeat protein